MLLPFHHYQYSVADRFLRYVQVDTQSDPLSSTVPSTARQKDLGKILEAELRQLGIADAELDEYGYLYATVPANLDKHVPVICFCSHIDTSPDCSGHDVKPIVHRNYDGKDIRLPDDPDQVLSPEHHPDLLQQTGNDIITASGTTLLGADNKSGIAAIMDAVQFWTTHPEVKHGPVRILFTIDEEIGRGVDHVNLEKLGADYAYTIDGETAGSLEDETFCADAVTVTLHGIAAHTGFAKGKLVNAIKIAAAVAEALPKHSLSPETTEGKEGFIHPLRISGTGEKAVIDFLMRDFTEDGLHQHEQLLENIIEKAVQQYPGARYEFNVTEQYRNMKHILDQHPQVIDHALEAIRLAGLTPKRQSIRGGTDGSRLSFMGLPCPNIFAGEHAFHSKLEWVSVQDMQKAVQTIVYLAAIWERESGMSNK